MLTLLKTKRFWLKFLRVTGQTSYQSHANRTEYHIGVSKVLPGEKHRISHGFFIEIANGQPEEEDITRYEDTYGRC